MTLLQIQEIPIGYTKVSFKGCQLTYDNWYRWTDGATTIMNVGDTHYSTTSGSYASKSTLTGADVAMTTLGNHANKNSFWQLQANLLNPNYVGTPSQTVTVTGIC